MNEIRLLILPVMPEEGRIPEHYAGDGDWVGADVGPVKRGTSR